MADYAFGSNPPLRCSTAKQFDNGGPTLMSEIDLPSLKELLWQKMQGDLAQFIPEVVDRNRLMCCACGRFLSPEDFDVDHMIPRQAIKCDPEEVRNNPKLPQMFVLAISYFARNHSTIGIRVSITTVAIAGRENTSTAR
jgi:hypothetical protein